MPRFEDTRRYRDDPRALVRAVDEALHDVGAASISWARDRRDVTASIGISFLSWGERLRIEIHDSGRIVIESACAFPLQLIDWGKNASNVNNLFYHIEDWLDELDRRRSRRRDSEHIEEERP